MDGRHTAPEREAAYKIRRTGWVVRRAPGRSPLQGALTRLFSERSQSAVVDDGALVAYSGGMDLRARMRPLMLAGALALVEVVKVAAGWGGSPSFIQWALAVLVFGGVVVVALDPPKKNASINS